MILERIWRSPEARLLPIERLHVPTVTVMAIMTFAMIVVGAAGLALANAAGLVASGVENRYVVELPAAEKERLAAAVARIRSEAGVSKVAPVPEAEMRATLERWLGGAASSADLPVPALVTFDVRPGTDLTRLEARVRQVAPGARLIAQTGELRPLLRSIRALQWLAFALIALMAAATSAAIVLAARGALDTHRSTIEIMHGIGATDEQVTALFQRKIALDAMAGALAGGAAAALVLVLVGSGGAALAGELAGRSPLGARDLVVLALMPLAAVALATFVARFAVLRALRSAP